MWKKIHIFEYKTLITMDSLITTFIIMAVVVTAVLFIIASTINIIPKQNEDSKAFRGASKQKKIKGAIS